MTREQKDLLLRDLCAKLPYEVKVQYKDDIFTIDYISGIYEDVKLDTPDRYTIDISEVKPYLFPLSSMTEEQKKEYYNLCIEEEREELEFGEWITRVYYHNTTETIDWLNRNHFDYSGLIEKGLAIDCTNLDIY